jgi:hypothetical protein
MQMRQVVSQNDHCAQLRRSKEKNDPMGIVKFLLPISIIRMITAGYFVFWNAINADIYEEVA